MISRAEAQRARRNLDVLNYIESHAAFGVARLSKRDIAQGMRASTGVQISERTVQHAWRDLQREGKLKITEPAKGRGTKPILNVRLHIQKGEGTPQKGEGTESSIKTQESNGYGEREKADSSIQKREKASPFTDSPFVRFCRACENTDGWRIVERVFDGRVGKFAVRCTHRDLDDGSVSAPPKRAEPANERADSVSTSLVVISNPIPENRPKRSQLAEQLLRELWARMSPESRVEVSNRFGREEPGAWRKWVRENDELTIAQLDAEQSMGDDSEFNPPEAWLDELRDKVDA